MEIFVFVAFFGLILFSRNQNLKAGEKLSADKKAELVDLFSKKTRKRSYIIYGVLFAYILGLVFFIEFIIPMASILFIGFLGSFIYASIKRKQLLVSHNFPGFYIKSYNQSVLINLISMCLFITFLFIKFLSWF